MEELTIERATKQRSYELILKTKQKRLRAITSQGVNSNVVIAILEKSTTNFSLLGCINNIYVDWIPTTSHLSGTAEKKRATRERGVENAPMVLENYAYTFNY